MFLLKSVVASGLVVTINTNILYSIIILLLLWVLLCSYEYTITLYV